MKVFDNLCFVDYYQNNFGWIPFALNCSPWTLWFSKISVTSNDIWRLPNDFSCFWNILIAKIILQRDRKWTVSLLTSSKIKLKNAMVSSFTSFIRFSGFCYVLGSLSKISVGEVNKTSSTVWAWISWETKYCNSRLFSIIFNSLTKTAQKGT